MNTIILLFDNNDSIEVLKEILLLSETWKNALQSTLRESKINSIYVDDDIDSIEIVITILKIINKYKYDIYMNYYNLKLINVLKKLILVEVC